LARKDSLKNLPVDDRVIVVPFKVEEEIKSFRRRRSQAKEWLHKNRSLVKNFRTPEEGRLYLELVIKFGGTLGEGERAAIAISSRREGTFVSGDRLARQAAIEYGVTAITPEEFENHVVLRFPLGG
jgi:predicted nucleic acid-binding protein